MPAILMGPLGKIIGVVAIILAVFLYGEWHGRGAVQQRWDAAIKEQAVEAAENVIKNAENTAKVQAEHEVQLREARGRVEIRNREVIKYVKGPSPKCPVSPELEYTFNDVSQLLGHDTNRVSTAAGPTGEPPHPSETNPTSAGVLPGQPGATTAQVTDAELLLAYTNAVEQLDVLWIDYAALVEWTRSSYAIAREGAGRTSSQP